MLKINQADTITGAKRYCFVEYAKFAGYCGKYSNEKAAMLKALSKHYEILYDYLNMDMYVEFIQHVDMMQAQAQLHIDKWTDWGHQGLQVEFWRDQIDKLEKLKAVILPYCS